MSEYQLSAPQDWHLRKPVEKPTNGLHSTCDGYSRPAPYHGDRSRPADMTQGRVEKRSVGSSALPTATSAGGTPAAMLAGARL